MIEVNHYYAGIMNNETVILQITSISNFDVPLNIHSTIAYHPTIKQRTPPITYSFHSNSVMAKKLIHLGPATNSIEYYLTNYPELFI